MTEKELFERAMNGDVGILKDKDVSVIRDAYNWTPLHRLGQVGCFEILSHRDVGVVKENGGCTPLHFLSGHGGNAILAHKLVAVVKDNLGFTPLHNLAWLGDVTKDDLKKLFPWFPYKGEEIDVHLVTKILKTPNSLRFIYMSDLF